MRFLLLDSIVSLESGGAATGIKNVTMSEDFLTHHFPNRPIMPGMLIIESLVQLADWVIREHSDFTLLAVAEAFDRIKFRRVVTPGDQLLLEVTLAEIAARPVRVEAKASVGGTRVASARLALATHPLEAYIDPDAARRHFRLLLAEDRRDDEP